jgi:MFS family permease
MAAAAELVEQRPSRVRYGVLAFAASLAMLTYLDRACIGSAVPDLVREFGLRGTGDLFWVLPAFTLAYALMEVPSGWLGDVFGPRSVLIRIVLWWSLFTALTGLAGMHIGPLYCGLMFLVIVQFLFGIGEAGAFPNITRALHNWFPITQRGLAQGTIWMSGRLMGGLTPLVWTILVHGVHWPSSWLDTSGSSRLLMGPLLHWRQTFWLFGLLGVVWCTLFALWFRNRPEEKASVNEGELALIRAGRRHETEAVHARVPWLRILASRNLWCLCLMYACQSYGWYFNIFYLPAYLQGYYKIPKESLLGAMYAGGPLWMGAAGCLVGGFLTDWFIRRTGNRRWGRRLFGLIGHSSSVVCFLACPYAPSAFWFFLAISLSAFASDLTMGSSWASCQDIGRRYSAIVAGFMNMVGNLGGTLGAALSGWVLQRSLSAYVVRLHLTGATLDPAQRVAGEQAGYELNFLIYAAVYAVAVLCWSQIDASRPVAPEEEGS